MLLYACLLPTKIWQDCYCVLALVYKGMAGLNTVCLPTKIWQDCYCVPALVYKGMAGLNLLYACLSLQRYGRKLITDNPKSTSKSILIS